ncbi:MAG: tyrosine-type recombinase/integrase [Deltaproteobacteria bacterium]|nr:tyrosine-type recombinase/integrase [Deltaproteobacteria bacterium]
MDCCTAWNSAIKKAGVVHIPMINVRHASVTAMLSHGADLAAVAAQAGHSSVTTTSTFYAHITPGWQKREHYEIPLA